MMEKRRRIVANILFLALALVMLVSSVFVIAHADHDCAGEGCSVCAQIETCREVLEKLSVAAAVVLFALAARILTGEAARTVRPVRALSTPITLRVKLSN